MAPLRPALSVAANPICRQGRSPAPVPLPPCSTHYLWGGAYSSPLLYYIVTAGLLRAEVKRAARAPQSVWLNAEATGRPRPAPLESQLRQRRGLTPLAVLLPTASSLPAGADSLQYAGTVGLTAAALAHSRSTVQTTEQPPLGQSVLSKKRARVGDDGLPQPSIKLARVATMAILPTLIAT